MKRLATTSSRGFAAAALIERNADGAAEAMRQHLRTVEDNILAVA